MTLISITDEPQRETSNEIEVQASWKFTINLDTVNRIYTDIRYNDKTRYNDNLNGTNP